VRIDLWSDLICPWCYLGEHRLQTALDQVPWGSEVEVRMHAFQLDPTAPTEPHDLRAALERKYGPGAFDGMTRRLTALGRAEGLDYRFDRAQRVNTFDGHRLVLWADSIDPATAVALTHRLFVDYFTEGANLADHEVLVAAAGSVGLDGDAARTLLAGSAHGDAVRADTAAAHEHGITGVPAFVIEGQWLISGAQDVDTLVRMLERARERLVPAADVGGDACAVDDPRC
jgi:predicted DsbA family dithiol-disulfide isomerase